MTNEQIIAELRSTGLPSDLTDAQIEAAITWVLRRIKNEYPLMVVGLFTSVVKQQVYDLFNPVRDETTQQGVFPGGLRVYEITWSANNSGTTLDVFGLAPLLQGFSLLPGTIYRNTFYTPGDWVIWDLNWSAFMRRFAPNEFDNLTNALGSPIRIYPVPTCASPILAKFTFSRTLDQIMNEDEDWFFALVESRCYLGLANIFSLSAGTKVGEIADNGKTVAYWQDMSREKWNDGWAWFERRRLDIIHPATRSHGP